MDAERILARIDRALDRAGEVLRAYTPGDVAVMRKEGGDPVTEADRELDAALKSVLPEPGDGWLSEETVDDRTRLACRNVWVVDPLDGTKEFVKGLPEWSVSIGYVVDGDPVAGGILNPSFDRRVLGAVGSGVTVDGRPSRVSERAALAGASVLASRSEISRGEWARFDDLDVTPCGSVAWKLALVAAGDVDATWTLVPKHEWDVAAGAALVRAAGGAVFRPDGRPLAFNLPDTRLDGLVACGATLEAEVRTRLRIPENA